MLKSLFFTVLLFANIYAEQISGHTTRPNTEQVIKDFKAKNFRAYKDNFQEITTDALLQKHIIQDKNVLVNLAQIDSASTLIKVLNCDVGTNVAWSSTVYDFDVDSGYLTCLVAPMNDINNPIGVFKILYTNAKFFFSKNLKKAKTDEAKSITAAEDRFKDIADEKQSIKDSIVGSSDNHLTIPQLLLSVLLTDDEVIDVEATKDLNKIQLKNGYTTAIIEDGATVDTNKEYILNDLESVFVNYAKISDLTMTYLLIVSSFLMMFGLGGKVIHYLKTGEKANSVYIGGVIASAMLFIPYAQDLKINDQAQTFQTKYQDFERAGYYLFSEWARKMSNLIIDTQIDSIIAKSGIGTADQIVDVSAGKEKYKKVVEFTQRVKNQCSLTFKEDELYLDDSKYRISDNSSTPYPTSENWAYANALYQSMSNVYYYVTSSDGYTDKTTQTYNLLKDNNAVNEVLSKVFYPRYTLAFCGKNYFRNLDANDKLKEYENLYNSLVQNTDQSTKIGMVKELVKFQYKLQRDWGFLGVLGLPVTKLQVEMISNIYQKNNEVIDKLSEKIASDDKNKMLHSFISSIPYMFVPGSSTVYNSTLTTIRDITHGAEDSAAGWLFGKVGGNVAAAVTSNGLGFGVSFLIANTILVILPIVSIIAIGILRFIVILVKIFVIHFSMLFMIVFALSKNNIELIAKFSLKVLSVMFELPVFVLSVYLAIVANDLVLNTGTLLSKTMIVGLIDNSNAQHLTDSFTWQKIKEMNFAVTDTMKIYFIDGFFEVLFALFSIFIIYKILVSLHNFLFEQFELNSTQALEGAIESIKQESSRSGAII